MYNILGLIFNFFQKIRIKNTLSKNIGITEAICPYCGVQLKYFPKTKKKCAKCGNFIYKRTRPFDNKPILIKDSEIEIIEDEWAKLNGTYEIRLARKQRYENMRKHLQNVRNCQYISDKDIEYNLLQNDYLQAFGEKRLANVGHSHFLIGLFLFNEKKYKSALEEYLIGEFYKMCIAQNDGCFYGKDKMFSAYNPSLLGYAQKCLVILHMTEQEFCNFFLEIRLEENVSFPFTKKQAIEKFMEAYRKVTM